MADKVKIIGNKAVNVESVDHINREFMEKSVLKRARDLGMQYIDIAKTPLNPDYLKVISFEEAQVARAVPFLKSAKRLKLAVEDQNRPETVELVRGLEAKGFEVEMHLASETGIAEALEIFDNIQKYKKIEIVEKVADKDIQTYEKEIENLKDLPKKLETVTAEEALNLINVAAMKTKTSDVHYEPSETSVVVRFRIDGILHKTFELNLKLYSGIAEQIKYQSKMRLNVTTVPQDGRYVFTFNEAKTAVRVASIPTPYGESFVCRYLPSGSKPLTFEELGFQGMALQKLENACKISQGMVLVTGPTGSGKTTTLYAVLSVMNQPENKIITLEDPVEYYIKGVTQSQIDEKRGYSFSSGLRSILRHDPDVVMLGEIRDLAAAETAAQAALTGHVLLSTLHTNSAVESIPRLINMGLPAFMVAPALDTVIAQRLVRKVCSHCVTLEAISESEKADFASVGVAAPEKVPRVHGCDICSSTGYLGRVVIAEVVTVDSEIKDLILKNASAGEMLEAAKKQGMVSMREDGFAKVAQGLTTLEEVHRVTDVGEILD